jgi:hypothetical protein
LLLDFSNSAAPHDASIDTVYTADECAYGEPDDSPAMAFPIVPGVDTGPAAICPTPSGGDDLDYYKFAVPAGTNTVTVQLMDDDMIGDLDLKLLDVTGATTISQSRGFTGGETIVCPGTSPPCVKLAAGDYLFEVFPATPGVTNFYSFSVTIQ